MIRKTNIANTIQIMRNSGQSVFSDEMKKKFGTIYTPELVVEKTVDLAWKYIPEGANKLDLTYCDPAAGDGNFMEYLYQKLMQETAIEDPVKRSRFILTKCLYGFEILEPMVHACKIRLILLHQATVRANGGDASDMDTLWDELHVYHGNTLCSPEDVEKSWYQSRHKDEGGLLSDELREKKYAVIVGNPPYTRYHKRDKTQHLSVPTKYRQKNLALSFWQWCTEHITATGVYSLNTIASTLNETVSGNRHVRRTAAQEIVSVIHDDVTNSYSTGKGGSVQTIIMLGRKGGGDLTYNGNVVTDVAKRLINTGTFINHLAYVSEEDHLQTIPLADAFIVCPRILGGAGSTKWNNVFTDVTTQPLYIAFIYMLKQKVHDHTQFKLISDYERIIKQSFTGQSGIAPIFAVTGDADLIKLLWCYLNSTYCLTKILPRVASRILKDHGRAYSNIRLNTGSIGQIRVPDFGYYKVAKPIEYQAVLDFAELHIQSNNTQSYCAGIDTVINNFLDITNA